MKIKIHNWEYEVETAETRRQIAKGLMFKKEIEPLLFIFKKERRQSFHTWFMKKSIHIILMDKKGFVLQNEYAKPFKLIKAKQPYRYVLELQTSHILCGLKVGQQLTFEEEEKDIEIFAGMN